MSEKYRKPTAFIIEEPDAKAQAAPRRKPRAVTGIEFPPDEPAGELTVLAPAPPRKSTAWHWGTLLMGSLFTLFLLWAGLATYVFEFFMWLAFLSLVPLWQGVMVACVDILMVMVGGRIFFGELITAPRVAAISLIAIGVLLVGLGGNG